MNAGRVLPAPGFVSVGVHGGAEPERLAATLAALGQHPPLVLDDRLGAPAAFNRLAAETDAQVVVLLESGAIPAPGAIERLVASLDAAGVGIAGPSTNFAWNEQCAFAGHRAADVARTAREAARRYGDETRSLAPLWGPADFCFAVHRGVVDAIGGADEGFGRGPCWEMEYCARAVRAGFDARWVCGAYVWRAPFTPRRRRDEARLFEASRRRYQDNLCALRLRGESPGYEPHCRGEACEQFAPRELITLHRPLPRAPAEARPSRPRPRIGVPAPPAPLVSCVMPTGNRADFALHAIALFGRQDYEPRELLIVDDADDDLQARLPDDPRVRYLRCPRGESIGAKRNRACATAGGAFLVQWDDDDWYGPQRLSAQLAPLLAGRADITALHAPLFFELDDWRFWSVSAALHSRLFVGDVHGGTLAFSRRVWERLARYPATSLAEDAALLRGAQRRGARLERVDGTGHFVYLRHGTNAWRFCCGEFLDPRGWHRAPEPAFPPADREFYAARSRRGPRLPGSSPGPGPCSRPQPGPPIVSAIMPTADRRAHVARSLAYFARQDHPSCELVVLDDGEDRVEDLIPDDPRIRYVALEQRLVLGRKRNVACELARGEIIVHWDDDDWQAPHRLSYQVAQLERHGALLCGPGRLLFFDPAARSAWLYEYPAARRSWLAGGGLCYRRSLWERNPFAEVAIGEDSRFVWSPHARAALVLEDHRFLAALVHPANTSRKLTSGAGWQPRPLAEVRTLLGADWEDYASERPLSG